MCSLSSVRVYRCPFSLGCALAADLIPGVSFALVLTRPGVTTPCLLMSGRVSRQPLTGGEMYRLHLTRCPDRLAVEGQRIRGPEIFHVRKTGFGGMNPWSDRGVNWILVAHHWSCIFCASLSFVAILFSLDFILLGDSCNLNNLLWFM